MNQLETYSFEYFITTLDVYRKTQLLLSEKYVKQNCGNVS